MGWLVRVPPQVALRAMHYRSRLWLPKVVNENIAFRLKQDLMQARLVLIPTVYLRLVLNF